MYKIIDDEKVIDTLAADGGAVVTTQNLQVHIDHPCGCKITQDKMGSWLFPCQKDKSFIQKWVDDGIVRDKY